jgi:tripartite-type tricarboxylate transporter receptor subunit TctC
MLRARLTTTGLIASILVAFSCINAASADTAEQFYHGKTITIEIGYAPGGGYDVYARELAKFYSRHLPGQPTVTTQNVPGAGSLKLANSIYSVAPRDGTVIGLIGREQITAPLFGVTGANFDATKINWIGNMDRAASLSVVWATSPIQTIADARKQEVTVGGTGPASTTVVLPTAFNKLMGYKFKVIAGYPGGGEITLALERGEVEGRFSWSYASLMSTRPDWVRDKKIRFIAASAFQRLPEMPDVPTVIELADGEQNKQVIGLILAGDVLARPFMAPPNLPPERLAELRDGFSATMRDAEFLAEAKQQKLDLDPMDWKEMTETINRIYATPAPVVKAAKEIIQDAAH